MYKIIIGIIAIIAVGWILFGSSTVDYVATVDQEVSALETELADIDAAVKAGTLTPAEAAKAQTKVADRIEGISSTVAAGQKTRMTDAQRLKLIDALERLKQLLVDYNTTIVAVDDAVLELPESDRPKLSGGGNGSNAGLAAIAAEAIEVAEDQVEEIVNDITDEASVPEDVEETATSSDEVSGDSSETEDNQETTTEDTIAETEESADMQTEESVPQTQDATTSEESFIFSDTETEPVSN